MNAKDLYIDLLKRALTDSLYDPVDPSMRLDGRDWPARAATMIGFKRLDNLQFCIGNVLANGVAGDLIETGVWRGGATIFMRAMLAVHGVTDRRVWVADSFEGLPPPDPERYPADSGDPHHTFSQLAVPLEEVQANFEKFGMLDDRVHFLKGWFHETLADPRIEQLAVLRLDGDMYGSTMEALEALYPKLSVGGYVIIDDYGAVPGCRRAVDDYRAAHAIADPIQPIDWAGVFWQRTREHGGMPPLQRSAPVRGSAADRTGHAAARPAAGEAKKGDPPDLRRSVNRELLKDVPDILWTSLSLSGVELPPTPPEQIQRNWCGNSGVGLAAQTSEFYSLVKQAHARYASSPLADVRLLDFGCGWGRLARLFLKELSPEQIHGCDPDEQILAWCRRIPGTFRRCDPRPRTLPFDEPFDLAYAFSVFTHLGPKTHRQALEAIHGALKPGALFVATIRPRTFVEVREFQSITSRPLAELQAAYDAGEYLHEPYNWPAVDGEVTYGETVVPLQYVEAHWSDLFELLAVLPFASDPYQVPLVLRRR